MQRILTMVVIGGILLGASCTTQPSSGTTQVSVSPTPDGAPAATPTSASTSSSKPILLWVYPSLSPDSSTPAGTLLSERLASFEEAHPGVTIEIRIKDEHGVGSLVTALTAASSAAPDVLPDAVMLSPAALHIAKENDLIALLEELVPKPEAPDWYDHAVATSRVEGEFYGLPFASETDVLVYQTALYQNPPLTWSDILAGPSPFLFPGGDPSALFTLTQYFALGGTLEDGSGDPTLVPDTLDDILAFYESARTSAVIPLSTLNYTSSSETWSILRSEQAASAVTPLSRFLTESDFRSTSAIPLPTRSEPGTGLAKTWNWAVVTRDPLRRATVGELLIWLNQPDFLGQWTHALGLLPPTASALAEWPEGPESALVSGLVTLVDPYPAEEVFILFGPHIREAVETVIRDGTLPSSAAFSALRNLQSSSSQ
jgi:ABC-type glycerol-3-phosphate transport system substrate-binding protein